MVLKCNSQGKDALSAINGDLTLRCAKPEGCAILPLLSLAGFIGLWALTQIPELSCMRSFDQAGMAPNIWGGICMQTALVQLKDDSLEVLPSCSYCKFCMPEPMIGQARRCLPLPLLNCLHWNTKF